MATRRERIVLEMSNNFTGRMALAAQAVHDLNVRWSLDQATWEPIDWDRF